MNLAIWILTAAVLLLFIALWIVCNRIRYVIVITEQTADVCLQNSDKVNHAVAQNRQHADAVNVVLRTMNGTLKEVCDRLPPMDEVEADKEKAEKARESINKFNDGISAILDYDGGAKK